MFLSEMRQALRDRLVDGSDTRWTSTEKDAAINYIYRDFCEYTKFVRRWVGFDVSGVYSDYTCSDWDVLDVVAVSAGSLNRNLQRVTVEQAMAMYTNWDLQEGSPLYYLFGDVGYYLASDPYMRTMMKVLPFPSDAALTNLNALAIVLPPDMAADDAVPLIPRAFHDCLVDGAAAHLIISANQARDLPAAQMWQAQYMTRREAGLAQALRLSSPVGRVVPYRNV